MRRALLVLVVLLALPAPAHAYWRTLGGPGSGASGTSTLAGGQTPTAVASGRTVTVTFAQTQFLGSPLGGYANGGYTIRRAGTAVTAGTCAGTVSGVGAPLSCTETGVPFGDHTYTVQPTLDDSWTGDQSSASATVEVAPDAPATLTATSVAGAQVNLAWAASAGATSYAVYRGTTSGTYSLRTTVAGTTHTDTGTDGTPYFYVVRAIAAGNEGPDSPEATAVADSSPPNAFVVGAPTYLSGTATVVSANATDSGSGIASVLFQAFVGGSWLDICTATVSPYSCPADSTQTPDGSYSIRAIATDRAGYTATSPSITRVIDNTAPATTLPDPGSPLRATVSLANTASDGGSGLATVKVQRSPAGAGTWSDICSTAAPAACSFDTTTVADGVYDLRVLATDNAGNQGTTVVPGRVVDNTRPSGVDVQATNRVGGTAGRIEQNDVLTFTFSEAMKPSTFLAGWTGASTNVTVTVTAANPGVLTVASGATQIPLGSVNLGKQYATLTQLQFTASPMVMSGSTVTITMGTLALGGIQATATGTGTLAWTTPATPTDVAGNALNAGTVNETGTADLDF